jgi:dihydrofolate synthase/folylpolyglutamate synthase
MVSMPHWPKPLKSNFIQYDLTRITKLLDALSSPHLSLPPVIHIAGTNGKGSTAAYLKAIFQAAGLTYHSYTSPHLIEFNERIIIRSEKITDGYLFELCERTKCIAEKIGVEPTFFEGTTACAFLGFAENPADVVILETGLGGRLDATNVIPNPLMTIITPVSFDHMEYLGPTIIDIAGEKAGIIKHSVPCIISHQLEEALEVLLFKCQIEKSPAIVYQYDFGITKRDDGFNFESKNLNFSLPSPSLRGDHQILNAATVIAALALGQKTFNFTTEHFIQGVQNANWPARIEKIPPQKYSKLLSDKAQVWVDGAHNEHGAKTLANWIQYELREKPILIVGMTKNRDVVRFLSQFHDLYCDIYTVPVMSEPLSYSAQSLSDLALSGGIKTTSCLCLEDALSTINNNLLTKNVVITGSLFLAADFFKLIGITSL